MPAFDQLEQRLLQLSLGDRQDSPDPTQVVGLFKAQPAENHNGDYGLSGEPAQGTGVGYRRARASFGSSSQVAGKAQTTNTEPIVITGLTPGTYTHFGVFGSNSGGAA